VINCDIVTETDQIVLLCFLAGKCYCVALLKLLNSHKQENNNRCVHWKKMVLLVERF